MSLRSLASIDQDERLEGDICIIGSGPAGATIARELAGSRLRVIVVESGGTATDPGTSALNDVDNVGAPRFPDQTLMRSRILGGTSHLWTGRCTSFDPHEYDRRPWVPHSGWPITSNDITSYLDRAATHLGLGHGSGFSGDGFWALTGRPRPPVRLDETDVRAFFWQFSRTRNPVEPVHFGPSLLAGPGDNIHVVTNATAVHLDTNEAGSAIRSVEVATPDDRRRTIHARRIVLCGGGIENARLLLASNRQVPHGLGNERDLVGRFLMDHPRGGIARFDPQDAARLTPLFDFHYVGTANGTHQFCQGLQLSPGAQAREGLLGCAVWLSELVAPDDPWSAAKRLALGRSQLRRDVPALLGNLGWIARGLHRRFTTGGGMPRKLDGLELQCIVEQPPDPDSRITLSDRVDRHGVPLPKVHWRINEQEQHTARRTTELVIQALSHLRLPTPTPDAWVRDGADFPATFSDVAHHIGTTRMAAHPRQGVVDADCQAHGVDGLYIAGSSVFPTSGHANPTQTIVALAIRLADTLKQHSAVRAKREAVLY